MRDGDGDRPSSLPVMVTVAASVALLLIATRLVDVQWPWESGTEPVVDHQRQVDLTDPYAGTPAANWANGEAAIVPPAAEAVGTYTATEVADAYERVRQLLVTSRLDPAVLQAYDHNRYLALLSPEARPATTTRLSTPGPESYLLVSRIAPGHQLLPVQVKVTGGMWAEETRDGTLAIHTNYAFAYAFAPADLTQIKGPLDIVAVERFKSDYLYHDDRWPQPSQGIHPGKTEAASYSIACEAHKRGELAPTYSEPHSPTEPSSATEPATNEAAAFDPAQPLPKTATCHP